MLFRSLTTRSTFRGLRSRFDVSTASARRTELSLFGLMLFGFCLAGASSSAAEGEPAESFLASLRAVGYFDTAIVYLDRVEQYPGVDGDFKKAIPLEKAQTYVDAARSSRSATAREGYLKDATDQLDVFLKAGTHPRQSEARMMLGTLQMFRGAQTLGSEPDDAKRKEARETYLAAAKTFSDIVEKLRNELKEMQGAKIDAKSNPGGAALRDQLRGEFLQGMTLAGEAWLQAAKTYNDPGKQAKKELSEALKLFTDLSEKYDDFPPGAIALMSRGLVQELLSENDKALDSFIRMLETQDVDDLRDAKFQAASGLIRLSLADKPPKFQMVIDRVQPMIDSVRPNERRLSSAAQLHVDLAEAYLAKSRDKKNQKPADLKRAESDGRQLLIKASKIDGDHVAEATRLLASMGIEAASEETAELPTAEDPVSLDDAYAKTIELYQAGENYSQMLATATKEKDNARAAELEKQVSQTRQVAMQILSRGLSLIRSKSDVEMAGNARQLLAFLLYQDERFHDASVVGSFLAKSTPGTDMGMKGGLIARNALQNLLVVDTSNAHLIAEVKDLADFVQSNWPTHAETPVFQRLVVELALQDDQWDQARGLIEAMGKSTTRSLLQRKLGLFLYQASITARAGDDETQAAKYLAEAKQELKAGLDSIEGGLADEEAMKAALILAKIQLRNDEVTAADKTLNNDKYGPLKVAERLLGKETNKSNEAFASDLYSTELNLLVQKMTAPNSDTDKLVGQASDVMEKLRASVTGPDASARLSGIYLRMARDIREQLDGSEPGQKAKLIGAFRVFLERISATTEDQATLQWIGQTVMALAESSIEPGQTKATGQAAELLATATETFERLKKNSDDVPLTVDFQLGRAQRLSGNYKGALDTLDPVLRKKPNMLNAQMEAANAYEQWAATLPPTYAGSAYKAALNGARPDESKKNVIWGWGKISQLTSSNESFRDMFFDARYHVALCRYLWGKSTSEKTLIEKSVLDITKVAALYPELGGDQQRRKFDSLLKLIQKELGQKPEGLPPIEK
ncbi:hypothetical protein Poly51_18810 [Rubripirellula tenax]|uniref:Tetratricopeptide repeat protein n=1 Tax=Rubripirellula tenax TaxID=2528015 RepID=A0A5C6FCF9_9BACT|nr:hypothetical protein [Rubripirellula tenax]TWU59095.1 hypothetical protein Poly51_18810 [Rubripirellula tenax]